jgi:MFS family permease
VSDSRLRNLKVLYATIFLNSTGFGTTTFLLPVYAASIGADYIGLGAIGAVGNVAYTIMTLTTGFLLDRLDRVRFYVTFTLAGAGVLLFFTAADSVVKLMICRGLLGLASGAFWVTASTLTADISPPERLTQSMGRYNLSWIAGFVFGPYIGGIVSSQMGFTFMFLLTSTLLALSVVFALVFLKPDKISSRNEPETKSSSLDPLRKLAMAYTTLLPFTVVLGIYMAIVPGTLSLEGINSSTIGLLITITNCVRGFTFMNVERLVKWGTRRSINVSSIFLVSAMVLFSLSGDALGFGFALTLYGVAAGIMTPVILNYIAERCGSNTLGKAMGLHEGTYGVGMTLGPMVGGGIADVYGASVLYQSLALVSLTIPILSSRLRIDNSNSSTIDE